MNPSEIQDATNTQLLELRRETLAQLRPKQWEFVRRMTERGEAPAVAYKNAGYACGTRNSQDASCSRALKTTKIALILTIEAEIKYRAGQIDRDNITMRFMDLARKAETAGEFSAARGCLREVALIHSIYPDEKRTLDVNVVHRGLLDANDSDWEALIEAHREKEVAVIDSPAG